jgi:hypothetical protein
MGGSAVSYPVVVHRSSDATDHLYPQLGSGASTGSATGKRGTSSRMGGAGRYGAPLAQHVELCPRSRI